GAPATKPITQLEDIQVCTRLPDHDWTVAPGHNLIPSVMSIYRPFSDKYLGPTYISIGSGIQTPPSPFEHYFNLSKLFTEHKVLFSQTQISPSPAIAIFQTDRGTDVNSRHSTTRMCAGHFAWKFFAELVVHVNRAPRNSALNVAERSMASLTKAMANQIY